MDLDPDKNFSKKKKEKKIEISHRRRNKSPSPVKTETFLVKLAEEFKSLRRERSFWHFIFKHIKFVNNTFIIVKFCLNIKI